MLRSLLILFAITWLIICFILWYYLIKDARIIRKEGSQRRIPLWLSLLLSPLFSLLVSLFFYGLLPFLFMEMLMRRFGSKET